MAMLLPADAGPRVIRDVVRRLPAIGLALFALACDSPDATLPLAESAGAPATGDRVTSARAPAPGPVTEIGPVAGAVSGHAPEPVAAAASAALLAELDAGVSQSVTSAAGSVGILWRHTSGLNAVWLMSGSSVGSTIHLNTIATEWQVAGVADFNADGSSDIFWRHTNGYNAIWLMDAGGVTSTAYLSDVAPTWTVGGVADFDGDGNTDILWRDSAGNNAVWLLNGTSFVRTEYLNTVATSWQVAGLADFSGDGRTDVFWRDQQGHNAIWLLNGTTFVSTAYLYDVGTVWHVGGVADFNGDGRTDILWRDGAGTNTVWLMNGTSFTGSQGINSLDSSWHVAGLGDFSGSAPPPSGSSLQSGVPIGGLSAATGQDLVYKATLPSGISNLRVALSGGSGDADVYLRRTATGADVCKSTAPGNADSCEIPMPGSGDWYVVVRAKATFSGVTLSPDWVTDATGYTVSMHYVTSTGTASYEAAIDAAAARWGQVLTKDFPGTWVVGTLSWGSETVTLNRYVDDILVVVSLGPVDGKKGGAVAQARVEATRWANGAQPTPYLAWVRIDEQDAASLLASGTLGSVAQHEIGHGLGIGTLWKSYPFDHIAGETSADPYHTGSGARSQFDLSGGLAYSGGAKVPVEATVHGHWRENALGNELMTPTLTTGPQPLSRVTLGALVDMGYGVSYGAADAWTYLPPGASTSSSSAGRPTAIDMSGDVVHAPMLIKDEVGQVWRLDANGNRLPQIGASRVR